ncbi:MULTISPECIES: DUF3426 domain-containing protein [Deefgea]|uniref:DUF3426 domain-containing protein n=1 Tax=Deefgea chitinilytica TaxID=570276 RepID=A0ABS2CB95_9NEIS|nr:MULTISPECIES: DUF3426 domain-containing protein [Deefgea]MBM5571423.1 DUF3426 domain-containing protein [Deefgea chitinilytica]MBM9888656.1 DUF3426 domain-containing protein [Deefgea sp. CFH1-16]
MSQITCCPNCSTTFRVTDAQLAAHQGKVRCGRCAFVFHAPDFIQSLIIDTPSAATTGSVTAANPVASQSLVQPKEMMHSRASNSSTAVSEQSNTTSITSKANKNTASNQIPKEISANIPHDAQHEKLAQLADEELALDAALSKNEAMLDLNIEPEEDATDTPARAVIEIDSESEYQPILTDDDLFAPAQAKSRFTWLWVLGCALASIVLVAQLIYVFRNELSQEFPALRPKLLVLCEHLNCSLPLPREAQLLRSEYSELTFIPNSPTLIQLNATLRNLAPFEQELPKLEVTLTDENEKVVVRKIFTAQQYLLQNERTQNTIEANEEVRAFLQLDLGELHSTGYSLYWFY